MYELIILCQLMTQPMHGYLIASIINDMIGPFARVSNGRLYPLLAKLQADGLIEVVEEASEERQGERQTRSYRITAEGRKRWHQLMMDTNSNPGEYQKFFFQKAGWMRLLKPAERMHLIDHYINYCQAHVLHIRAEAEELAGDEQANEHLPSLQAVLDSMQHLIDQWQLELTWAQKLREREIAAEGQTKTAFVVE